MYNDLKKYYDTIFPCQPAALKLVQQYIDTTDPSGVVELGCGTGTLLRQIKHNYRFGIDPEISLIQEAKANDPNGNYHQGPLNDLSLPNCTLFYSLGNVISHLTPEQLREWAELIFDRLSSSGHWLVHTIHWDRFHGESDFTYPALNRGNFIFHRSYSNMDGKTCQFSTELLEKSPEQDEVVVARGQQMLYSHQREQILNLHRAFEKVAEWKDYAQTSPSDEDISRVYLFRKP